MVVNNNTYKDKRRRSQETETAAIGVRIQNTVKAQQIAMRTRAAIRGSATTVGLSRSASIIYHANQNIVRLSNQ